jgi:hypothetical protein
MKNWYLFIICGIGWMHLPAQLSKDAISTDFVLYQRRVNFDRVLRGQTINATFALPLDSTTEDRFREACWSISQFLLRSPEIEKGFGKLFSNYETLDISTKRALLEAVYGTYPQTFQKQVLERVSKETVPKLFAVQVLYLYRIHKTAANTDFLRKLVGERFPGYQEDVLLNELDSYLQQHEIFTRSPTPGIVSLFDDQKRLGQKIIYSFQRWNRDYPGLALIQNADGSFCKDGNGKLLMFEQLARSASDLPYFITNGNTPQGIYSIQGTEVSHNNIIGPTPNIQMVMPFEADSSFWHIPYDSTKDALTNYLGLLPGSWRSYLPMTETFYAGKAGRSEIIAHGTTIDPDYFKDRPFYPLTPTQGCLCAKETWNIFTGKILQSDQFDLVNTFLSTPGNTGYLMVINIDNQQKKVGREEIEKWVQDFERTKH